MAHTVWVLRDCEIDQDDGGSLIGRFTSRVKANRARELYIERHYRHSSLTLDLVSKWEQLNQGPPLTDSSLVVEKEELPKLDDPKLLEEGSGKFMANIRTSGRKDKEKIFYFWLDNEYIARIIAGPRSKEYLEWPGNTVGMIFTGIGDTEEEALEDAKKVRREYIREEIASGG